MSCPYIYRYDTLQSLYTIIWHNIVATEAHILQHPTLQLQACASTIVVSTSPTSKASRQQYFFVNSPIFHPPDALLRISSHASNEEQRRRQVLPHVEPSAALAQIGQTLYLVRTKTFVCRISTSHITLNICAAAQLYLCISFKLESSLQEASVPNWGAMR